MARLWHGAVSRSITAGQSVETYLFLNRVSQVRILPRAPASHQPKCLLTCRNTGPSMPGFCPAMTGHPRLPSAICAQYAPKLRVGPSGAGSRGPSLGPTGYRASPISSCGCAVQGVPALTTTFTVPRRPVPRDSGRHLVFGPRTNQIFSDSAAPKPPAPGLCATPSQRDPSCQRDRMTSP
jgi:hypothetical protein